jgi:hypothetical protein
MKAYRLEARRAWRVAASIVFVLISTRADPITVIDAGYK